MAVVAGIHRHQDSFLPEQLLHPLERHQTPVVDLRLPSTVAASLLAAAAVVAAEDFAASTAPDPPSAPVETTAEELPTAAPFVAAVATESHPPVPSADWPCASASGPAPSVDLHQSPQTAAWVETAGLEILRTPGLRALTLPLLADWVA